eukprot:2414270-Pyramimonas_sp.AAC.1
MVTDAVALVNSRFAMPGWLANGRNRVERKNRVTSQTASSKSAHVDGRGLDLLSGVKEARDVVVDGLHDGLAVLDGLGLLVHQLCWGESATMQDGRLAC